MAGYTLSEKIFSRASKKEVKAGEFVMADIDRAMVHDITGPLAVKGFREIAGEDADLWDNFPVSLTYWTIGWDKPDGGKESWRGKAIIS